MSHGDTQQSGRRRFPGGMAGWLSLLLGVAAVIGWSVYASVTQPVLVELAVAQKSEIRSWIEERATTRFPVIHRISMPLDGRILPITLLPGDRVSAGQTVAQMDPDDLETELADARAQVAQIDALIESVENAIKAAQSQVKASSAKVEFSDEEYQRIRELIRNNAATPSEESRIRLLKIESALELEQDALNVAVARSILAATGVARQNAMETLTKRQRDRARATIISPVDGVVLSREVANERVLSAGEILLEIGRLEDLEIESDVLTQDAVRIPDAAEVAVIGAAIGTEPVAAKVERIYPRGFTRVSSLGVEQQRVKVIIRFDPEELQRLLESGRRLRADYRVRVRIFLDRHADAVTIPRAAIFRGSNGDWQVFAVRNGQARRTSITLGLMNDFEVEVTSGMQSGDSVIIAPESSLSDGQRVASHAEAGE